MSFSYISIPSFPNPADPTTPLTGACGVIGSLSLITFASDGKLTLDVYASLAAFAAGGRPVGSIDVRLGQVYAVDGNGNPTATFPTLAQLMAAGMASPYAAIESLLISTLIASVPAVAGAAAAVSS